MKKNIETAAVYAVTIVAILGVVLAVRLVYAKLVYNDLKCAVAECRIAK